MPPKIPGVTNLAFDYIKNMVGKGLKEIGEKKFSTTAARRFSEDSLLKYAEGLAGKEINGSTIKAIVRKGQVYQLHLANGKVTSATRPEFRELLEAYNLVDLNKAPPLHEVFDKGVENYTKKELENAIGEARTSVYRYDRYAPDLIKRGFDKELTKNPPFVGDNLESYILSGSDVTENELHAMVRTGKFSQEVTDLVNDWSKYKKSTPFDTKGLYWGKGTPDPDLAPPYQSRSQESLVKGVLNPKAIPGIDVEHRGNYEVIQKEPGQVLAKYGDLFKIIGLGGATTLGSELIPEEAEAGPISGRIGKTMAKALGKVTGVSSTAERLIGKEIDGKIIKDVIKGEVGWRYILFEDGTRLPVRKDVIGNIIREKRTEEYIEKFREQEDSLSKLQQAMNSLKHHLSRQQPLVDKGLKEEQRKQYSKYMTEINQPETPWTFIESHNIYLPEEYAKVLEDAGIIQIKKGK